MIILDSCAPEKVLAKLFLDDICAPWGHNFVCDLHETWIKHNKFILDNHKFKIRK